MYVYLQGQLTLNVGCSQASKKVRKGGEHFDSTINVMDGTVCCVSLLCIEYVGHIDLIMCTVESQNCKFYAKHLKQIDSSVSKCIDGLATVEWNFWKVQISYQSPGLQKRIL